MSFPTLFVSHGAPTFALEPDEAGQKLSQLGASLARPKAVLVVSPHWSTSGVRVSGTPVPETIHDFGGFSPELYEINYPVPGHPDLAQRTADLLFNARWQAQVDSYRGLDHGAWVPLLHLLPQADVPVYQV